MFKFVHAADLHLDSPLRGLERYEGAPVERLRNASRRAMVRLVDLCIAERAAFLLLAGDIFDGDWKDYSTGLFFAAQLSRLREAGIPALLVHGNHDFLCPFKKNLDHPNLYTFPSEKPASRAIESVNVVVHGQSYNERDVRTNLAAAYPPPTSGTYNIGLLHTAADGREGHESYAPCSTSALANHGYDYWALGHVHNREVLSPRPFIVFPGNLQGRHARETGPKGATLVTVDDAHRTTIEHRTLDAVRWEAASIDVADAASAHDVLDLVEERAVKLLASAEGRLLALRITVEGMTRAHDELARDPDRWTQQIRLQATDAGGGMVWLEKIRLRTRPRADLAALSQRNDPIGKLLKALHALRTDDDELRSLIFDLTADLQKKLPPELREGADPLDLARPDLLHDLIDQTEAMLLPRLLDLGEER